MAKLSVLNREREGSGFNERGVLSLRPEGKRFRKGRITPERSGGPEVACWPVRPGEGGA